MMFLSKTTLFLAASFATMQMAVAIAKPESFIHASAQVVNLNNSETFMVSSHTAVNCVENKLEPMMVPPSSSPIMDVIPSFASINEEVEEIKIAVHVATESNLFGQTTHELIFFDKALFAFGPVGLVVLLSMVVMTIFAFKWIFLKDCDMVDRCDGNKIHRTLALPMSETYLQIVPRAPRTLATYNDCRDIVATSSTALVVYVPRTLATYNACRDLVVVNTALVPYAPRTLTTVGSRAIVPVSTVTAIVPRAPRCITIFNDCRDLVIYQDSPLDVTAPTAAAAEAKTDLNFLFRWFPALCAVFQKLADFFSGACRRLCDLLLSMQSSLAMLVAAFLGGFFHSMVAFSLIGFKILHQATTRTVPMVNPIKIFDIDLSDFDYDYEVINVMADFDATAVDRLYRVNEGIQFDAPPMAIDAAFIGPTFVEMRHPQTDLDDDEVSVASSVHDFDIMEEDAVLPLEEEPEPIKMFQDFCEFREPQADFDEEDLDDEQDDFDSQMEDLLFSFSKLSFKDNSSVKTVSDSEMDELANAFAKL